MNILFIHQNMPGQYRHLAPALARDPRNNVVFLTRRADVMLPGVVRVTYKPPRKIRKDTHPYLHMHESAVLHGQQVVRAIHGLMLTGFTPDLVIGHPGWGELLFVKDLLPDVPLISYCEFFYSGQGPDVGFASEDPVDIDVRCRARARSSHLLLSLEACDIGVSPTHWQKSVHPEAYQDKIEVLFDGIDTGVAHPDGEAKLTLPDGTRLKRGDELVTYVARNLEPYRGFKTMMRAVHEILRRRKNAHIVIVGGDEVSYGSMPDNYPNWRAAMLAEVEIDQSRVHFTGKLPYLDYLKLLRASRAHVYLTYPFVLSWSCLEAMACGALVIASDTAPVREVIQNGRNGLLTDFADHAALADKICTALATPADFGPLCLAARETIVKRYSVERCLTEQLVMIERVLPSRQLQLGQLSRPKQGQQNLRVYFRAAKSGRVDVSKAQK
jgi:glycosyltransferase involved in cell wall biosynthesis